MSGNPFRQSLFLRQAAVDTGPAVSSSQTDSSSTDGTVRDFDSGNASPPPPAKTKKSVRIESPTSSTPHPGFHDIHDPPLHRTNRGSHAGSPPPASPSGFSDDFSDSLEGPASAIAFGRDERGDAAYGNPDMMGSMQRSSTMETPVPSSSGAPVNPFSRTLATMEPHQMGSADLAPHAAGQNRDRGAADKPAIGTPKANLDVEGFKRLLMTGISGPVNSSQSSQTIAAAPSITAASAFESSSTDTSSVSRQSIFEPAVQEPHVDTPRTSYEMAQSDDETIGLVTDVRKKEKKKPPPAPKHRHGKLVSSRTPQVVSFSEFEATQAAPSPISRSRTDSNLNKPLPPTPSGPSTQAHIVSQDISQDAYLSSETGTSEPSGQSLTPPPHKKVPPPVPLARRQSQLRSTTGNRSRSSSNLTVSSQHSITEFPMLSPSVTSDPSPIPSHKAPPPPPPARRHGSSLTGGNPPSTNSSTTELSTAEPANRANISSPNPPPSRKTTFSSPPPSPVPGRPGLARTASANSSRAAPRSVSNESTTMPPPPPPPRRRQSGRSSLDQERPHLPGSSPARGTSSENKRSSFDGKRRTSVASESSLKYEYSPAAETDHVLYTPKEEVDEPESLEPVTISTSNSMNILDEMEKFQREIDELKERYQKGS